MKDSLLWSTLTDSLKIIAGPGKPWSVRESKYNYFSFVFFPFLIPLFLSLPTFWIICTKIWRVYQIFRSNCDYRNLDPSYLEYILHFIFKISWIINVSNFFFFGIWGLRTWIKISVYFDLVPIRYIEIGFSCNFVCIFILFFDHLTVSLGRWLEAIASVRFARLLYFGHVHSFLR